MELSLHFKSYICHPYLPAKEKIINIQKQSGFNRARSLDKRESTLLKYLEQIGMSKSDYDALEKESKQQWYFNKEGFIIVPSHQVTATFKNALGSAPAGCRICPNDQLRSLLTVSDFTTTKKKADRVFERFVMVKDAKSGKPLSHQRQLQSNEVIDDFVATGTVDFCADDVKRKGVVDLISYSGKWVGCGSSRVMGYGRFSILD